MLLKRDAYNLYKSQLFCFSQFEEEKWCIFMEWDRYALGNGCPWIYRIEDNHPSMFLCLSPLFFFYWTRFTYTGWPIENETYVVLDVFNFPKNKFGRSIPFAFWHDSETVTITVVTVLCAGVNFVSPRRRRT